MLNVSQLQESIDSIGEIVVKLEPLTKKYLSPYYYFLKDTTFKNQNYQEINFKAESFIDNFPKDRRDEILNRAIIISRNIKQVLESPALEVYNYRKTLINYYVEWHRKILLAFTVFSLFLIGAPLGAIIRKGGLGLPAVVSTVLFVFYYIISLIGEKLAKQSILTPFWGMWLPVFIMFPLGMFLIYKANKDSKLFSTESYNRFINWILATFRLKKRIKPQQNA